MAEKGKGRRVILADEWRGLVLLLMVFYHGCYDLVALFGVPLSWFYTGLGHLLQQFICISFILISGLCCRFSRSNLKRGAVAFGLAMALTLGTLIATPQVAIWFGVLHLLGVSMMLYPLLRPALDRLPRDVGLALFLLLFLCCKQVPSGWVGLGPWRAALPAALYQTPWLAWLGFPGPGFSSGDYFPLIPWLLLFLAGSFLGRRAQAGDLPNFCYRSHLPWLAAVGRASIWIYMLHQPVLYGALWLYFRVL